MHHAKASRIFSTKNIGVFQILTFEILTKRYNMVSFEQPGPGVGLHASAACQNVSFDAMNLFLQNP